MITINKQVEEVHTFLQFKKFVIKKKCKIANILDQDNFVINSPSRYNSFIYLFIY